MMKNGCNEDMLKIENPKVLTTKHFWGLQYLLVVVGSFVGQYLEWGFLVNNPRIDFNCSPWIWYKTPITLQGLRLIITFVLQLLLGILSAFIGGYFATFNMFFSPMLMMFGLRYLFYKMKLDNSNAYEHDFLTRDSALELSQVQEDASRDARRNAASQGDESRTDGDLNDNQYLEMNEI